MNNYSYSVPFSMEDPSAFDNYSGEFIGKTTFEISISSSASETTSDSSSTQTAKEVEIDELNIDSINDLGKDVLKYLISETINELDMRVLLRQILDREYLQLGEDFRKILLNKWEDVYSEDSFYKKRLKKMAPKDIAFPAEKYLEHQWTEKFSACSGLDEYARLNNSFTNTVEKLGKVIILEKNLPNFKKSIQPSVIGGVAGGIKYITYGILFKFAEDAWLGSNWLYGSHEPNHHAAGKALNNDLKALRALLIHKQDIPAALNIPIMSTISYLGYILCAVSFLPLEKDSLCYGTSDGGATYFDDTDIDPELNEIVNKISTIFHFADHEVKNRANETHVIKLAADVEIHRQLDQNNVNRYFILDLGRFFPPNNPLNPFLHSFRSEYLTKLGDKKISCDVFSGFGRIDSDMHGENALDIIKEYKRYVRSEYNISLSEFTPFALRTELHNRGINLRHLGYIREIFRDRKQFYLGQIEELVLEPIEEPTDLNPKRKKIRSKRKSHRKLFNSSIELELPKVTDTKKNYLLRQENLELIKNSENMMDYALMEMILRTCKTILQIRLRKVAEKQVIPDLNSIENETFEFHQEIINQDGDFWKSVELKCRLEEKFGEMQDVHGNKWLNVLSLLNDHRHKNQLISFVPSYCNYTGGVFLFEIETNLYSKSSIPEIDAEYVINRVISHADADLIYYWKKYRGVGIKREVLVPLAIACSQLTEDNMEYIDCIKKSKIPLSPEYHDMMQQFLEYDTTLKLYCKNTKIRNNAREIAFYVIDHVTKIVNHFCLTGKLLLFSFFNNLVELDVSQSYDICLRYVSKYLPDLKSLNVSSCMKVTDDDLTHLNGLASLTELNISGCVNVTDQGLSNIRDINNSNTITLNSLDISELRISNEGLEAISFISSLVHLNISSCQEITDEGIEYLTSLINMTSLSLSNTNATNIGINFFTKVYQKLHTLDISRTRVSEFNIHHLPSLTCLNMNSCYMLRSLDFLIASKLKELYLHSCRRIDGLKQLLTLISLNVLDISRLDHLPKLDLEFAKELPLKKLYLSKNNVLASSLHHIGNHDLEILDLSLITYNNMDEYIGTIVQMKNLTNLNLHETAMKKISDLGQLEYLEVVQLPFIDDSNLSLASWHNIRSLTLNSSRTRDLLPCLADMKHLNYLKIKEEATLKRVDISEHLHSNPNLHTLIIEGFGFSHNIRAFFQTSKKMRHLQVTDTKFPNENIKIIAGLAVNLETFILDGCGKYTDEGINELILLKNLSHLGLIRSLNVLLPEIQRYTNLSSLDFSINPSLMAKTAEQICALSNLKKLNLSYCKKLQPKDLDLLSSLRDLRELDITLLKTSYECIRNMTRNFILLTYLNISYCSIKDDEIVLLISLQYLEELVAVDLPKIREEGIIQMCEIKSLTALNISLNMVVENSVLDNLSTLYNLRTLDISETKINDKESLMVLTQLEKLEFIRMVGLGITLTDKELDQFPCFCRIDSSVVFGNIIHNFGM